MQAADVMRELGLEALVVEGGYFRQVYKSKNTCHERQDRACGTSIYYMLTDDSVSKWHVVQSDEIWHYYAGSPAIQILLFPDGKWERRVIGPDLAKGERPMSIIPAGVWQAAILRDRSKGSWGLFGASVFPGFEYEDFSEKPFAEIKDNWKDAIPAATEAGLADI